MKWSSQVANGSTLLTVCGSIDKTDASRLKLLMRPKGGSASLVLDLSEVTFLGPAGLDVLADAASQVADSTLPLAIVVGDCGAQVRRAIEDANLQQSLRLFSTVEHALAARPTQGD
jgi:anti-sigma B factor antagonist